MLHCLGEKKKNKSVQGQKNPTVIIFHQLVGELSSKYPKCKRMVNDTKA